MYILILLHKGIQDQLHIIQGQKTLVYTDIVSSSQQRSDSILLNFDSGIEYAQLQEPDDNQFKIPSDIENHPVGKYYDVMYYRAIVYTSSRSISELLHAFCRGCCGEPGIVTASTSSILKLTLIKLDE